MPLERAVEEIREQNGEIYGRAGDIGELNDARCIVGAALERFGSIEVLVNNASLLGPRVPLADYPFASWQEVMRVLTGFFS